MRILFLVFLIWSICKYTKLLLEADVIVAFLMHLFNIFFRFIENNHIESISPNAFRGLKTLVHL